MLRWAKSRRRNGPDQFAKIIDTVIRKRVYDGRLSQTDARKAFMVLDKIPVQLYTHPRLRQRTREIAEQFNLRSVYDASYAALADLHRCEFWTADRKFFKTVEVGLTFVRYLPYYPYHPAEGSLEQARMGPSA